MKAKALVVAVLVLSAVPAAACPFRPGCCGPAPDPVVAIEERLEDGGGLDEVVKSAELLARKKSSSGKQRAHALSVMAVAQKKLGDAKAAERTLERARKIDPDTVSTVLARIAKDDAALLAVK